MGKILITIAIILIIAWGIGFLGGLVTNGLIHLVLGVAVILFIISFVSGKRT